MKKSILLFVLLCSVNSLIFANIFDHKSWDKLANIKLDKKTMLNDVNKLSQMGIDIAGVDIFAGEIDVLIDDIGYDYLVKNNYKVELKEVHGVTKGPDDEYKTSEEIYSLLKEFSTAFPEITKLVSIGKSLEGRDIWAIKISDNAKLDESEVEPSVLFNGMHHAREVMTPEVALDIIEQLIEGHNSGDLKVQGWINSMEIWVMPMFNVDGNNKMWTADRWWRKNTRDGHGVDLNRNYPTTWDSCNGSSGWPGSQTYRGASPASEPETQAMMDFVGKIRPVFNISYHSYSEIVIYPLGCSSLRTGTKEIVEGIGKEIGDLIGYKPGTSWELLYDVDGGDIDWMYNAFGVIPYVIEVNSSREGFHPDYAKWRDVTVERNRNGWMHLLDRTLASGVRGLLKGYDGYEVEVYSKGKLFQKMKSHSNGVFHVVLNPGKYSLKFVSKEREKIEEVDVTVNSELVNLELSTFLREFSKEIN